MAIRSVARAKISRREAVMATRKMGLVTRAVVASVVVMAVVVSLAMAVRMATE
jgi:hypothetical protein